MYSSAKRCFVGEREETAPPAVGRSEPCSIRPVEWQAPAGVPRIDPLAGVPGRAEAEEALATLISRRLPAYAAVFIVDRIHLLNDCFGYDLGDRLLCGFHDRLRHRLDASDRIFRWSGTSFLALLERRQSAANVREELARVASCNAEVIVKIGDAALALATAASWEVFALRETKSKNSMVRCFDHYVAANLGR
jgi:diguanylate cyclase (GGDEF)-like protein